MHMLMTNHCTSTNMSSYRYHAVQLLMAQSQMRRGSHDEALSHWSELLSKAESSREKAYVYQNIAECCIQLGMENIDKSFLFGSGIDARDAKHCSELSSPFKGTDEPGPLTSPNRRNNEIN